MNEKRVLMILASKDESTPDDIVKEAMPAHVRDIVVVLDTLKEILGEYDLEFGPKPLNDMVIELTGISGENEDALKADIFNVLITNSSSKILTQEVPIQRKIIGRILGEVMPAVLKVIHDNSSEIKGDGGYLRMVEVMNASSWLKSKGLVTMSEKIKCSYSLSSKRLATTDLPERRALKLLDKNHGVIAVDELGESRKLRKDEIPIALGWLKKKGWATITKRSGDTVLEITASGKEHLMKKGKDEMLIEQLGSRDMAEDEVEPDVVSQLKKRQDILTEKETIIRTISLTDKGTAIVDAGLSLDEEISQLTPDIIRSGSWKSQTIRPYDLDAFAPDRIGGRVHPLQQLIDKIRMIFLEMGFEEIEGDFVQSAFWNMDALFTAQDHPVREIHDTLYMKNPAKIDLPDAQIVDRVKAMHESGDEDSDGWGYKWEPAEAEKALLRTHTTVNTIKYLSEHPDPPVKVFCIGRVFRNEAVDSTHLAEFHHVEGIVMEEGANMRMLVGLLKEFYSKMGIDEIRFRPGYFPYTEPSMEPEIYFNDQWMELGGSGIFRPEVVSPFGVKHPVLAWGLGLERLAMALFGLDDIRKLYVSDIDWLRSSPIVR